MSDNNTIYDITIIGGGPVGLFTAFYANLRQAKVKIIESLETLGGQPPHLYAEKQIYDIPAYPKVTGEELSQQLIKQVTRFNTRFCLGEEALEIEEPDETNSFFTIKTSKAIHYSKTIIMAAGSGAFSPKKLNLSEAAQFEGRSLHYFIHRIEQFTGRTVAVCGGGDSAVDWALALEPYAEKVYLIHRRNQFRAVESSVSQLYGSSVEVLTPYVPSAIHGKNASIEAITLTKARENEKLSLNIDDLIVSYGFSSSLGEIRNWGFTIKRNAIEVNSQYETSIPGIFAVGDIAQYEGKIKIIATGFGEAPQAVNNALRHINPANIPSHVHSSELFKE